MSLNSYKTIDRPGEGLFKEKGSKFLSFAFPVKSEFEIKQHLENLRKKYFDARHHCYAWILGPEKKLSRAFDDGEPNHSAGDPILGQIRSKGLTDVLVVVVRYFGGIKLGVGRLISAYKIAAQNAIINSKVIEKEVTECADITFDYTAASDVMKMVKDYEMVILSQQFDIQCRIHIEYAVQFKTQIEWKIEQLKIRGKFITIVN